MATITTDTYLDDGITPRTAGETWVMNGGVLTIRTDTRVHTNAPAGMTGTLGAMTISSTLGGGVLLDGRNVRWLEYNSGSGNVPAIGTIISQGGVEGYLLGVWQDYVSAPTPVGDAMPTTGYMKFREITGGSFSAGALAGIGASAVSPDRVGWIEVVQRQAVANTVPRLGFYRTRGDWFYLDNTNGTAGQIIQVPTNGGGSGTRVPAIWIETGVGTNVYEAFPAVASFWFNTTNLSTDDRSKFVLMDENGAVRIGGNGTDAIGFLPPSGCRIRIPNVIGRQSISANDSLNEVPSTAGTAPVSRPDFTTTAAGVIDFEYFLNDWYNGFVSAYSVRVLHSATLDTHLSHNEATPSYLEDYVVGAYHNFASTILGGIYLLNNSNGGIIKNCKFYRGGIGAGRPATSIIGCINYTFENFETGIIEYNRNTNQPCNLNLSDNNTFTGITKIVNTYLQLTQSSSNTFDKVRHINRFVGETNSANGINAILMINKSNNNRVNSIDFGGYNCHPYGAILSMTNSSFNVIKDGGSFSNPIGGTANLGSYVIANGGNCVGNKASNIYLKGTRANIALTNNSSKDIVLQKLYGSTGNLINTSSNVVIRAFKGNTNNASGQLSVYGYHFSDIFFNDTEGVIRLAFNEPTPQTANQFEAVSLGIGAGFTSTGNLSMPNLGDQVIWTMETFVKGHTGFRNVAPLLTGTGTANFSYEYDIDIGSGFTGIYKTLNTTNLTAEIVNATTGFRLKYRITCTNAVSSNAIAFIGVFTESTATAQENIDYPFEFYNLTLNGILANSRLQVYDLTNNQEIFNDTIASAGTFTKEFEFTGNFSARFRIMLTEGLTAYKFIEFTENITSAGFTRTINYELDQVYIANGINGEDVDYIIIDDDNLLVNIDTGLITWQEIYAYETYWLYTEEGIRDEGRFIEAVDGGNYKIYDFKIKNVSDPSLPLLITNGFAINGDNNSVSDFLDLTGGNIYTATSQVVAYDNNQIVLNDLDKIKKNTDLIPAII